MLRKLLLLCMLGSMTAAHAGTRPENPPRPRASICPEAALPVVELPRADSIPLMQTLCVGGAFMPLYTLFQNLAISRGRSGIYMWCNIAQIALQIAIIMAFHSHGIEAIEVFQGAGVRYAPGKAANAGGVATSGLEMCQNSARLSWTAEEVDARLKGIMTAIHANAYDTAERYGKKGDYLFGANVAGFVKVADAMIAQGHC